MKRLLLALCILLPFYACEKKEKESAEMIASDSSLEASEKKIEEKRASGDTLSLSHEELGDALPSVIEGFQAQDKGSGQTTNEDIASFSVFERKYKKGDQQLTISLADYNGAYGLFAGATAIFDESAQNTGNDRETVQIVKLRNNAYKARVSFHKETKEANLIVGINERYVITLRADNQKDTEEIKRIFESMNLEKLGVK